MAGTFDVVVIGGGPGGYVPALRAAQLGARTAVVEKDRVGGTCLVRGCIPTKALLESSELYTLARDGGPFGLVADSIGFDWTVAQKRKTAVVDQLVKGVEGLLKAGGITVFKGSARLTGKGGVAVSGDQLQAKNIIIATGSAVARIPLPGAELTIDSDQILELKEAPRRRAVVGGGVVGMEFAAMFAALGSKVTVLEMLPQVLAMVDADLVTAYSKHLASLGAEIHTNSKVSEVVKQNGSLLVRFSTGGEGGAVDADQVLLAVGRVPYTQGLEAEKAGVKLERGRVAVDDHLHTTADGVWAIGDVIGGIMLAHVASYEGVCAVENIAGHANRVPDYHAAPNCVYTDPEIAHVGLGEKEAREKGIAVKIGRFPFAAAGRALTLGQTEGFVKVVADAGSGQLLGAHIIGPRATDLIAEATLAVQNGLTLEQIDLTIHAHPTLPESLMEAALAAQGRAIHIPNGKNPPLPTGEQSEGAVSASSSGLSRRVGERGVATEPSKITNRETNMAAPVKTSSPPPTPSAIDPKSLELKKENRDFLLGLHRQMQLIRRFEERTQEQYTKAKIGGYCHLNIGEEATVVGGILPLQLSDYIFTSYREHGHAIARGIDPKAVMAELFGKETGTSHGRGGSMHLFSADRRFYGGYAIVGEALPIACGSGYAINYKGTDEIVMSSFGDGATNIGAFHESLNVAKLWHLPIVFVCVNNLYGMGTAVNRASAVTEIWKKACAYDMTSERVDGMDVLAVRRITEQLVAQAREEHEPSLLECVTYRYRGHSMSDPDTYRGKDEIKEWQTRDAILSLGEHLKKQKMLTDQEIQRIDEEVTAQVEDAVKFAEESPDPDPKDLYRDVYAGEAAG